MSTDIVSSTMDLLRANGLRATPQREITLKLILSLGKRFQIQDLIKTANAQDSGISRASVYRALDTFVEIGVVFSNQYKNNTVFELNNDPGHFHVICETCYLDIELDWRLFPTLANELEQGVGFHMRPTHAFLYGLCKDCAQANT